MKNIFATLKDRKMLITLLLGFSSGLPLALTGSTLSAWYAAAKAPTLVEIGFLSLATWPYTLKFLWAPLMDRWVPPLLGRRRGWILIFQILLCLGMASMALLSPNTSPKLLLVVAFLVAFFSASQDIAFNAYCTDLIPTDERALGAAMNTNGYRIAMLISGGLATTLAGFYSFQLAYFLMMALMGIGIVATFLGPDPEKTVTPPKRLWDCTVLPFIDFIKRPQAISILLFIVFYKLGDAYAGALSQTFLIREIKFTLIEIGLMAKTTGFLATILGTTTGALLIPRYGWVTSLFMFGVAQAISNLAFILLMWTGPDYTAAAFVIFIENFCGGMGTAAFLGFMMGLCNARFTAFQFALLSSLSSVGRVFMGPLAGTVANDYGWVTYFMSSLALSLPGLILILWLRNGIDKMTETQAKDRENQLAAAS